MSTPQVRSDDGSEIASAKNVDLKLERNRERASVCGSRGEHGEHTGQRDATWRDWYAGYVAAEQAWRGTAVVVTDAEASA